jgi:hypothetical protein
MRESQIELYFKQQCAKNNIWQNKFLSGVTGIPDRIAVSNSKTVFVELKTLTGKASARQKRVIDQIKSHGGVVFLPRSKSDVDDIISYFERNA